VKVVIMELGGGLQTLEDFAAAHGLTMLVNERPRSLCESMAHMSWPGCRYCARFDDVETKDGLILTGEYGNGATPEAAIIDYAKRIAGKRLVFLPLQGERKDFDAPNEWAARAVRR